MSDEQIRKLFAQNDKLQKQLERVIKQQAQQLQVIHNWGKHVESYGKQTAHLSCEVSGAINHMREVTDRISVLQRQVDRVEHDSGLHPAVKVTDGSAE